MLRFHFGRAYAFISLACVNQILKERVCVCLKLYLCQACVCALILFWSCLCYHLICLCEPGFKRGCSCVCAKLVFVLRFHFRRACAFISFACVNQVLKEDGWVYPIALSSFEFILN